MILDNEFILERYIRQILNSYFNGKYHEGSDYYNVRCNVCGDSKDRKAYILKGKTPWMYYCHRGSCGYSKTVTSWMKEFFPIEFKSYFKEILMGQNNEIVKPVFVPLKKHISTYNEKKDVKYFIPILKGDTEIFETAINFCISRKIPENVWKNWFVAINGKYVDRLVIPFYNNNQIYYFQCRSLKNQIPKYLNRIGEQWVTVYNYYNIDKTKPVIIVEGPIDSLFLENSIALTGVRKTEDVKDISNPYYLLDNDKAGKKKSLELLKLGKSVFVWQTFLKDLNIDTSIKDINDVIISTNINQFTFLELEKYFTSSFSNKMFFEDIK